MDHQTPHEAETHHLHFKTVGLPDTSLPTQQSRYTSAATSPHLALLILPVTALRPLYLRQLLLTIEIIPVANPVDLALLPSIASTTVTCARASSPFTSECALPSPALPSCAPARAPWPKPKRP